MQTATMVGLMTSSTRLNPDNPHNTPPTEFLWITPEVLGEDGRPSQGYLRRGPYWVKATVHYELIPVADSVLIS